jgi:predicted RNA binding protein YcfA (HicA-like mRNA interferase family)
MTAREMIRRLTADGWYELKSKPGSHRQFKHPKKPGKVTVSDHKGDIPLDTLKCIELQAGLKIR